MPGMDLPTSVLDSDLCTFHFEVTMDSQGAAEILQKIIRSLSSRLCYMLFYFARVWCVGMHVAQCTYGGQRTTIRDRFFPSICVLQDCMEGARLGGECFYPLSLLASSVLITQFPSVVIVT